MGQRRRAVACGPLASVCEGRQRNLCGYVAPVVFCHPVGVKGLIWTFSGGGAGLATGYFLPALRAESPASTATRHSSAGGNRRDCRTINGKPIGEANQSGTQHFSGPCLWFHPAGCRFSAHRAVLLGLWSHHNRCISHRQAIVKRHVVRCTESAVSPGCRYRDGRATNMRTTFAKILDRAGVPRFERPFCNLRSSRVTELRQRFDPKVVAVWLGHSESISTKHYTQVRPEDFAAAVAALPESPEGLSQGHSQGHKVTESRGIEGKQKKQNPEKLSVFPGSAISCDSLRVLEVLRVGFEPTTYGLRVSCSTN